MDIRPRRENCEDCCKQILIHHKFLTCCNCNKISHFKCGKLSYIYNQTTDKWSCRNCSNTLENRYNPFDSICYNKYIADEPDVQHEIEKIKYCLSNCKVFTKKELGKAFFGYDKKPLSVFCNNIDGMSQNFDPLYTQLSTINNSFDIIALAETNILESHKNLYNIPGYLSHFNSKFCDKHKGSGLGIYVNDNFIIDDMKELTICSADIETLFIKISNSNQSLYFGVVYRPPSGNIKNFYLKFEEILGQLTLSENNSDTIICGDFNINLFKNDSNKSKFENIFFGNCFIPTISLATHEKPGCDPSCIDNVFVSNMDNVIGSGIMHEIKVSHHCPTICFYDIDINIESENDEKNLPQYDYCESNLIQFNDKLIQKLSMENFSADEKGFNSFAECVHETINECFKIDPSTFFKSRRNRLVNPWITNGLIKSINYKNFLYEKWKKSKNKKNMIGDQNLYGKYKDYRKRLKVLIKGAKQKFYSDKFDQCKGNSKKTWELINELRGKIKTKPKAFFFVNGTLVKERRVIADEFNKYFTSIASNLNDNALANNTHTGIPVVPIPHFSDFIGKRINDSMYFHPCSEDELRAIINDLDNCKASDISIRVLKKCIEIFHI